jgi:hypothetical protein
MVCFHTRADSCKDAQTMKTNPRTSEVFFKLLAHRERSRSRPVAAERLHHVSSHQALLSRLCTVCAAQPPGVLQLGNGGLPATQ